MKFPAVFQFFPELEALGRNLYWRFPILQNLATSFTRKTRDTCDQYGFSADDLILALKSLGVRDDDVIILHSSMKELSKCGLDAVAILSLITHQLCPKGTIVCPTFPLYRHEPQGTSRITKYISNINFTYNVQKSMPWTGQLGRVLMRLPESRRSLHPLNTITAYGSAVKEIFANESIHNLDLPCGPNSTWAALAKLNSKIIMLGVDMAHSLTMIHVAEDCFEDSWPISDWYRYRSFTVVDQGIEYYVKVRERQPRWTMSYAERKLSFDLFSNGIAKSLRVGTLDVTVLESELLLDFLNSKKASGYPYYLIPLSRQ